MVAIITLVYITLFAILYAVNDAKLIRAELKNDALQREINGLKEKSLKDY